MTNKKVRPAVVLTETDDKYKDLVVSAISSVVPPTISRREILLKPNKTNKLRVESILKVDRIVTLKREDIIANLGRLSTSEISKYKSIPYEIIK